VLVLKGEAQHREDTTAFPGTGVETAALIDEAPAQGSTGRIPRIVEDPLQDQTRPLTTPSWHEGG